jgi:outer membrane protein TolC
MLTVTGYSVASEVTSLDSLISEALERNPEILKARADWEAASMRPYQAGSLPDPIIGVGWRNVRFDEITLTKDPDSMLTFSFSQEFPFPGKLSLQESISRQEAEAQKELYEATVRRVKADLKEAFYDWFFVHKSIEITGSEKEVLERFLKIAATRYEVGKGIQQDVLKAQVEISRLIEQLELLRERKGIAEARIKSILNRPPDSPLGEPEVIRKSPFSLTEENLYALIKERSPQLRAKGRVVGREEEALKLAKRQYFPDFALGVAPSIMGMAGGGVEGAWEVNLGVKVPLYFWRKQAFGVKEAVSGLQAAREDYAATRQSLFFDLKEQYLMARTSENLLRLYEEGIIPQASMSLESAISGYQVGNIDFLTLLDNLITLYNFEIAYYMNLTNYEKALARIEEVIGEEEM